MNTYYQNNREKLLKLSNRRQKRLRKENPSLYYAQIAKHVRNWRARNPIKAKAHRIVFVALRAGRISKEPCFCGIKKVQAHHNNYRKPLEIIWYCKRHHIENHVAKRGLADLSLCFLGTTLELP